MGELKTSQFLTEMMAYAKTVGNSKSPPFTAERFLIAIIDCADGKAVTEKNRDRKKAEALLKARVADLAQAKAVLMEYVCAESDSVFLDDLYMKKRLQEARASATEKEEKELSAADLLECILREPSRMIRSVMNGGKARPKPKEAAATAAEMDNLFKKLAEEMQADAEKEAQMPQKQAERSPSSAKRDMSELVSDVKRIRDVLGSAIFGQDHAINEFATGYFQANMLAMIDKTRTRPRATFLFAGPPGVGKTFMAERAAAALELPFMRFDMSEYADKEANIEFCGSDKVYKNGKPGNVTSFVEENPKCVLLFDEIEKAHLSVIHLFLQMLDAGRLRDNYTDTEVSFSEAIIILTTNAGRQLYEDSDSGDFSLVSRKVIVKALQNDTNPATGAPLFPAAICSRFASGNVVMFNHISASHLCTIARKEIQRHAANLQKETGIALQLEPDVYTALLFCEGASVDARTIRSRAETFFNDELYELLRLIASGKVKTGIEQLESVHVSVDLRNAQPEIRALFSQGEVPSILVFAQADTVQLCRRSLPDFQVLGAQTLQEGIALVKDREIGFVLLDMGSSVAAQTADSLNIEDVESPARDFYRFVREQRSQLPVYLLEGDGSSMTEEERVSFLRQGVRGILRPDVKAGFAAQVATIAQGLHQQQSMVKLARANKLVSFETAQSVSQDGKQAQIRLFDLQMATAIDSEDSKNVLSAVSKPNVRFADVIGAQDAKKELAYFVEYLKNPKKYMGTGVKAPKGVLLYGPPGTGKTMLAKAMAKESDVTFIAAEGNQFLKKYIGEGPEKVHELFKTARKYAPAILFIDEIDAIGRERRGAESSSAGVEATLTAFLTEMDGFDSDATKPVFVLAATNFDVEPGGAKSLDAALMRRFDRRVYIELPRKEDRIRFMEMKAGKNPAFAISEAQIESLAIRSNGMSLAELDSAMELALRSAIREGSTKVTDEILDAAFETFNNGETKQWNANELERTARHEAGHAFLCWQAGETPSYLTVVARGNHGGYMRHANQEGKGVYTKQELLAKIRTALGGRAAEIVYYGDEDGISTGASGDLMSATYTAQRIVCSYGMDEAFGLAVENVGNTMPAEVRTAVNRILAEQLQQAIGLISDNKHKMDALVAALLEKDYLSGQAIDQILSNA